MAEGKKSFVLYCDLITVVEKLIKADRKNKTNYAGELFYTILKYVNDMELIDIDFVVDLAFEPIKLSLKRDLKKYELYIEKQKANGKKGGRPKKNQITQPLKIEPKKADSDSDSVSDSVSDTVNDIHKKRGVGLSEFENTISKYFSQTTEILEMRLRSCLRSLKNKGEFKEFEKQTIAYIDYKKLSEEKIHSWQGYQSEWKNTDWIDKLKKVKESENKPYTTTVHSNR